MPISVLKSDSKTIIKWSEEGEKGKTKTPLPLDVYEDPI
jgi:hypothetical protein